MRVHRAADHFLDDLRVAGWVQVIDQILRRDAARRLRDPVAVAVVDRRDAPPFEIRWFSES